jgi:hypothetical protein
MVAVTLWYALSARHTFTGPVRTVDMGGDGSAITGVAPAAPSDV